MLTADELKGLRSDMTDDEILEGVRKHSPDLTGDIDSLKSDGYDASTILDGIAKHGRSPAQHDPMDDMGALEKTRKALQYGTANALTGIGRTAEWAGLNNVGPAVTNFGKDMAPEGYRPASADFFDPQEKDKGIGGYSWSHLPWMVLEGAPGIAADLGASAVGTAFAGPVGGAGAFMASNAARSYGPNMDARMANQAPGAEPTATDYAVGAGNTALQAYLSKLGLKGGLGITGAAEDVVKGAGMKAIGQIPGQIAKAGAINAADGYVGSVVDQTARTAGTEHGLDINTHEALGTAASSGATGAAVRGLRAPGDVVNAARFSDVDADAASRVVKRFDGIDTDPKDANSAYKAVTEVGKNIATEIRNTFTQYKKDAKAAGEEVDLDTRNSVDTLIGRLKDGHTLNDGEIDAIADRIGDRPEGGQLVNLLKEHHELNKLKSKGRFEAPNGDNPDGYFAGGISSTRPVENVLNPANVIRSRLGGALAGGAAAAGVAGLPLIGQMGITAAAAAKVAAAQAGIYGGLRAADSALGLRNPTREFINRFRNDEAPEVPTFAKPAFKDQAADEAAQRQSALQTYQQAVDDNRTFDRQRDLQRAAAESDNALWDKQAKQRAQVNKALAKTVKQGQDQRFRNDYRDALEENRRRDKAQAALEKTVSDGENLKAKNEAHEARKAETARQNAARDAERTLKQTVTEGQAEGVKRDMDAKKAQAALEKLAKAGEANLNKVNLRSNDFGTDKTVKAMKAAEKLASKAEKPKEEQPKAKAEKPASEAPKGSNGVDIDGDYYVVRHGDQEIRGAKSEVKKPARWAAKVKHRMEVRGGFADELREVVGKSNKHLVDALETSLNNSSTTWGDATEHIINFVNDDIKNEKLWNPIWEVVNKHDAKLKASFSTGKTDE